MEFHRNFQGILPEFFTEFCQNLLAQHLFSPFCSQPKNHLVQKLTKKKTNINAGTSSSKPCLWPITDIECQVMAQMLRSTFLELILWRVQTSIEKTIPNIFLSMMESPNIIIYFYSKIRPLIGRSVLIKTRTIFITILSFAFLYISQNQVSVTFS